MFEVLRSTWFGTWPLNDCACVCQMLLSKEAEQKDAQSRQLQSLLRCAKFAMVVGWWCGRVHAPLAATARQAALCTFFALIKGLGISIQS